MGKEKRGLSKRRCVSLVQIVCTAVSAGDGLGETVTIAEATDALSLVYQQGNPCEMLHDGSWEGLTFPYSEKYAPLTGADLENKMIDAVGELYNCR